MMSNCHYFDVLEFHALKNYHFSAKKVDFFPQKIPTLFVKFKPGEIITLNSKEIKT